MNRYILDSYAMLAFFEDEPGSDRVEGILRDLILRKSKGYISMINWGEIYYNTYRVQGEASAESIITQLGRYPIELVDADRTLTLEAARLKGKYKIAFADCFAAALADRLSAKVVTGDKEFKRLEKEIEIEWII
jgi:predicted nucleic acid-binding protein